VSERVVACLSGGVDSSVAAALLLDEGYDVVGVFMRSGVSDHAAGEQQGCCSVEDAMDARRVADRLGIPFYALDMAEAFDRLIQRFVDDYARGWTPNPCVLCNRWLKFGHVLSFARKIGAVRVASGHYVRVLQREGRWTLGRSPDSAKDQSYVLAVLSQEQLAQVSFPLSGLTKQEVRAEAVARGFVRVAHKRDSQEICFVSGDYRELLRERLSPDAPALQPGDVVDSKGKLVGRHEGVAGVTLGQRKGLGVALGRPAYVQRVDFPRRLVTVGDRSGTNRSRLEVGELSWLAQAPLREGEILSARAQVRSHGRSHPARVQVLQDGLVEILFEDPVEAVAAGQAVVVYDPGDDFVLLSGWIRLSE
jgi:tRNA-specific 2-thiouridylase